jgi:branched-chain amino acid aminotransferase
MMSTRLEHATRMSTPVINVNGRIAQGTDATIPVLDHGFLYGEGVYEVCRTYHGHPLLFDRHMRRMRSSAGMIAMPVPFTDDEALARVYETLAAASLATPGATGPQAYVRLLLTRGVGELSYDPAACGRPSVVVIVKAHVEPPADIYSVGVRVSLVPIVRNHPRSLNPLIKSNNLLNNALAMQHALRDGAFEAVMRNHRGEIAECSQSNLFVVKSGSVITPPIDAGLLAGITRELLFEVAREMGVPMAESLVKDEDLLGADEAFLSSTTREVVPIVQVDEHLIGTGRPGPVTRALLEGFRRRADLLTGGGSVAPG